VQKTLEGIRVLDFSRYVAGAYCGALLADMRAEVIRVERPGGETDRKLGPFAPNGESLVCGITLARNKKDVTLNTQSKKGREILKELLKRVDIDVRGNELYWVSPGNPPTRAAVPYVDFSSGIYGALGAMFALYYREKTGKGPMLNIALLDAAISLCCGHGELLPSINC